MVAQRVLVASHADRTETRVAQQDLKPSAPYAVTMIVLVVVETQVTLGQQESCGPSYLYAVAMP